ncbi:NAD-dependent protein deacetylase Sirt6-like [Mytilus edulis]|uniref:NAD-dependent protein deacetylase Sirt6-like n=1 Tax=Mytilus edulis TaxID=6550 RepID=UPI0039F08EE7
MCDLKCCKSSTLDEVESDIVEVKTVWPKRRVKTLEFHINWAANGEARFHEHCWTQIISSIKNKRNIRSAFKFSSQEKTLVKEAEKTAEFRNAHKKIIEEAKHVSDLIKSSEHCVAFTGAGISTSAGIGDYRGKSGKWTEMDQNEIDVDHLLSDRIEHTPSKKAKLQTEEKVMEEAEEDGVPYEALRPTYTHEALHKLMTDRYLKYIISQNGDGLHGLSGVQGDKISELHGNVFLEICEKCKRQYNRSFYVMDDVGSQYFEELDDNGKTDIKKPKYAVKCKKCGLSHRTGRKCESKGCSGYLQDSIINFRDLLDDHIFKQAEVNSEKCDLMLCLGTTLTVTPASDLVEKIKKPQRYVICNRQLTDKDSACSSTDKDGNIQGSRIYGDCDTFFKELMKNILDAEELKKWESERSDRMKVYDSQRTQA